MKKTLNINLAGFPFTIDDDAYNLLKDYLDTIRYAFETNEDTEDLASDIESRIAEILIEKENGKTRIVTLQEITEVIERIGKPSEFIEIDETVNFSNEKSSGKDKIEFTEINSEKIESYPGNTDSRISPPPYENYKNSRNPFARKRIFRDPQNAMLGGVCAGLAFYLHIDVTVIRLITVLLFFLSASTVAIVYIILWIVVPEARTPFQRMQMMGEDPTVENIGKTVTENFDREENQSNLPDTKDRFSRFVSSSLSIFVKCLIFIGLLIAAPLLFALAIALIGCLIAIFIIGIGIYTGEMFNSVLEGQMVLYILLAVIGGSITIGIPLWLFVRMFLKKKDLNPSLSTRRSLLIMWLCGIALLSVFTVKAVKKSNQITRWEQYQWSLHRDVIEEVDNMDEDDIEDIEINNEGIKFKTSQGDKVIISREKTESNNKALEFQDEDITTTKEIRTDTLKIENMQTDSIN